MCYLRFGHKRKARIARHIKANANIRKEGRGVTPCPLMLADGHYVGRIDRKSIMPAVIRLGLATAELDSLFPANLLPIGEESSFGRKVEVFKLSLRRRIQPHVLIALMGDDEGVFCPDTPRERTYLAAFPCLDSLSHVFAIGELSTSSNE